MILPFQVALTGIVQNYSASSQAGLGAKKAFLGSLAPWLLEGWTCHHVISGPPHTPLWQDAIRLLHGSSRRPWWEAPVLLMAMPRTSSFLPPLLAKAVTGWPRAYAKTNSPILSVGGVSKNMWPSLIFHNYVSFRLTNSTSYQQTCFLGIQHIANIQ